MGKRVKIVVAEPSLIIRSGVMAVLGRLPSVDMQVEEVADVMQLPASVRWHKPDVLIINPSVTAHFPLAQLKAEGGGEALRCVALLNSLADDAAMKLYDQVITVYDSSDRIAEKIMGVLGRDTKAEVHSEALSVREKEIVVGVVKGLTNKQIADELCISTHTVITHRRNISSKLQIHSAAGLTIYAIVNKLVEFDQISSLINKTAD
ncbi:MAG: response regulator transcription factor [Rikenellaceae bacterium]|nr:response regulator transcription factor [Rikenellaceae bacterium]MDE7133860.1 response regulator transcription factor [Rikenellaceae bacterium]MDE7356204.1 response regulator transcription factor [Rikenellaceae bacterium]